MTKVFRLLLVLALTAHFVQGQDISSFSEVNVVPPTERSMP